MLRASGTCCDPNPGGLMSSRWQPGEHSPRCTENLYPTEICSDLSNITGQMTQCIPRQEVEPPKEEWPQRPHPLGPIHVILQKRAHWAKTAEWLRGWGGDGLTQQGFWGVRRCEGSWLWWEQMDLWLFSQPICFGG